MADRRCYCYCGKYVHLVTREVDAEPRSHLIECMKDLAPLMGWNVIEEA
jgi:hypothetical protein